MTSTRRAHPWRTEVEPTPDDGLSSTSRVQTDHLRAIATARGAQRLGALDPPLLLRVTSVLGLLLDLP
ncbi:type II toxin-antitoxin system PemK/MazF family toxin [Quadrisphaera sp. DSM 44207]|uniref:type II toxin-antitoxin system PemK/MazF family toxin n=1 Tax=Quadrisphaera sp. DSM 44207 TaxID=1881057 RepID=UPI00115F7D6F|nr:type II toxin-antitoxin system PemK/MazF family toxin [Quadrisphaera sp. DSM 44207]